MTEELIILDTIRFIKRETNPPTYVDLNDKIWWNFNEKRRENLRETMRLRKLINYDQSYHWNLQLRSEAYPVIADADKKLEKDFLKSLQRQPNIEIFMQNHFIRPNPKSEFTTHEHDNAIIFLMDLKGQGLIEYKNDDLNHISNNWYKEDPPINKRWFDSVDPSRPFLVELTDLAKNYLLLEDSFPIKTPTTEQTIQPKRSSPDGINVWNIVKNIWKVISENPLISAIIAAIIVYFIIIYLSNHDIKPKQ